jgi:hypothetical protein
MSFLNRFWNRRKQPKVETRELLYQVTIYSSMGNTYTIPDVSRKTLDFLKTCLGRDEIYATESIVINLRDFCFLIYEPMSTKKA